MKTHIFLVLPTQNSSIWKMLVPIKQKNIFQLYSIVLPIQFFLEVTSIYGTYLCLFLKQLKHQTEIKN